jgi:hypothetical protein
MRKACHDINNIPHHSKIRSPIELISNTNAMPNLHHDHPFGCPVFVLNNDLQSGKKIPKWEACSRIGIYLGPSIYHASNVGLVSSLSTGKSHQHIIQNTMINL